jgi:hypothetical protein
VVSDVPVDDESSLVTSGISRSAGTQSFRGAHSYVCVCVRVMSVCVILCNYFKKQNYPRESRAILCNSLKNKIMTRAFTCVSVHACY